MFTFFKKRLMVDTSSEESRRVTTLLEQNHIKYELRTIRSRGGIGTGMDAMSYARSNVSLYKGASQPTFVYEVYVSRKDFERAKELISK